MTKPPLRAEATRMFAEAAEGAAVAARALDANALLMKKLGARLCAAPPRVVVTCARGSSDHAATYARYLIETRAGILTSSAAPSVSSVYFAAPMLAGALYLVISQSGRSPDLLAAVDAAKQAGAEVVALVNDETSPLANAAHEVIPLHAGPELSVAATKSFLAALAAIAHLVGEWRADAALIAARADLAARLDQAWRLDWSGAIPLLRDANTMFTIGRGLGYGAAQEAALKFKETCGLHAEAVSAAEVMHGPLALAREGFCALFLAQDDETRQSVEASAAAFAARGASVLFAGAASSWPGALPALSAHPAIEPILMTQSFYRMANALAAARGANPDAPPHLNKVTQTL
jgi:glutamine---fructose-6-phosphate transaminase (isomerizing)